MQRENLEALKPFSRRVWCLLAGCESIDASSLPGIIQGVPASGVLHVRPRSMRAFAKRSPSAPGSSPVSSAGPMAISPIRKCAFRCPAAGVKRRPNLKKIGASAPLDDLELRMNRAAESAIPAARDLVIGAMREMTIEDALGILSGGDTAATDFLRAKTEAKLEAAFTPHVRDALAQSGAFTSMERAAVSAGLSGATAQLQSDLTAHAVGLGLDGLFHYVR